MPTTSDIKDYTNKLSILFVEDHEELRLGTTRILESIFKTVDSCSNGKVALTQYKKYKQTHNATYDIVLSDIEMPYMDGIELTRQIYTINPEQPIIILSAYDETEYLLQLIKLGIEQFIKKPIDYQELLQAFEDIAAKSTLVHAGEVQGSLLSIGENITYNKDSKSVDHNGVNIYLTKFEIIFIELLISQIGKIYSNEDIVSHYKKLEEKIDSSNIRKLVSKLRKKLSGNSIESIYGVGYKLIPYCKSN